MHQARPNPERGGVHRQDIEALRNLLEPGFDLGCLGP